MKPTLIFPVGSTEACRYAVSNLQTLGFSITDHPMPEITHLLLDVPSFLPDGTLRCGRDLDYLLSTLPADVTVIGGNLRHPLLTDYHCIDLLQDPDYLARNAAITADCALRVAAPHLKTTFHDTNTIILGWGRIGKCLAMLLKNAGCPVTVAARRASDRALLRAFGYDACDFSDLTSRLSRFQLLFNTIPTEVLDSKSLDVCPDCVKIELSSVNAIPASDTVIARGLPGVHAPKSSGKLIAETFRRIWKESSV